MSGATAPHSLMASPTGDKINPKITYPRPHDPMRRCAHPRSMRGAVRRRSCRWSGERRPRVETRISALGTPRLRTVGTTTGRPSMPAVSSVACGVSDLKAGRLRRRFARSALAGRVSGRRGGRSGSAPFFADCPHGVCRAPATPHVEAHEAFFERFITRPRCGAGTKGHASSSCVIPAKAGIHLCPVR